MERSFARTALFATAGLLIWAADFLFIYVFTAIACARGFAGTTIAGIGIVHFASALSTAVALVATASIVFSAHRRPSTAGEPWTFRARIACAVAVLGLIAIGMTGMPGVLVRGTCT